MIVMALGDTHGDRGFTKQAITWAADNEVDRIVQVGDFGFWPRTNNGQKFLHDIGKHSVQMHVPFFFIDGNHEDHLYLKRLRASNNDADFIHYSKDKYPVTYINRGVRWLWGDVWFGAFGGAFSIDRWARTEDSPRYGWFKEEVPDESKIPGLGKVDVLFTHDSPIIPPSVYGTYFKDDETSRLSQAAVYHAVVASKPALVIHGHWHLNERYKVAGAVIQALDMNQSSLHQAAIVFDTDTKKLHNLHQWEHREEDVRIPSTDEID